MSRDEWEEIVDKVIADHPDPSEKVNEARKKMFMRWFDDCYEQMEIIMNAGKREECEDGTFDTGIFKSEL